MRVTVARVEETLANSPAFTLIARSGIISTSRASWATRAGGKRMQDLIHVSAASAFFAEIDAPGPGVRFASRPQGAWEKG